MARILQDNRSVHSAEYNGNKSKEPKPFKNDLTHYKKKSKSSREELALIIHDQLLSDKNNTLESLYHIEKYVFYRLPS